MLETLDYLKAGYPIIWIQEKDEESVIKQLKHIAKNGKTIGFVCEIFHLN